MMRNPQYGRLTLSPFSLFLSAFWSVCRFFISWRTESWPKRSFRLPEFQAHRGLRVDAHVQENTLDAFRAARAAGLSMVECDVQLSADGEVVIFHDQDLQRIGGSPDQVANLTAEELAYRVGAPKLSDLLTDSRSPSFVNIELKTSSVRNGSLERAVVSCVREARAEERVLFSSFNPFSLARLAQLAPEVPRALLVSEETHKENRVYLRKMWLAPLARPHILHVHQAMATRERLKEWNGKGIPIAVWTVNDAQEAMTLIENGAASIISDRVFVRDQSKFCH